MTTDNLLGTRPDVGEGSTPVRPPVRFAGLRRQWALAVLIALVAVFSALHPASFMTVSNVRSIAVNASAYLIIAVGMTFVITVAGIDLAVGSVLVFAGVVAVKVMTSVGGGGVVIDLVGLGAALLAGLAWGGLNGLVVTRTNVPPLIVTLGTYSAAYGGSLLIAGGVDLRGVPNSLVDSLGYGSVLGIPYTVLLALAVALVGTFVMSQTRFGRHTNAIGSNVQAAKRAAIDVRRHVLIVYAMSGVLAGLAGYVSLARFSTTTLNGHQTDMLQAILAVVIGGTSLSGGVGSVPGTIVGVCIPAVLQDGFVIAGVEPFWQQVALGLALVAVVYVDQRRRLVAD